MITKKMCFLVFPMDQSWVQILLSLKLSNYQKVIEIMNHSLTYYLDYDL